MLSIVSGSSLGYSSNSPVVSITHSFKREQLVDLIRIAHAQWGDGVVTEALGNKAEAILCPSTVQFFNFADGGSKPTMPHRTKDLAIAEARKLAGRLSKSITVYAKVAEVTFTQAIAVTHA